MMIVFSLLAGLLLASSVLAGQPVWNGFEPASLRQQPEFERLRVMSSIPFTREIDMVLTVDERGVITSVTPVMNTDSMMVSRLWPQLQEIKLEPARRDGQKVASLLAAQFTVVPKMQYPDVHFPVGSGSIIDNLDLYRTTCRLNGLEPSELVGFPSYFHLENSRDSLGKPVPVVMFRLVIDSTGRLVASEKRFSSASGFDRQVEVALLRASFLPAQRSDTAVPCVAWLVVSFYPNVSYPTQVWERTASGEQQFLDQLRLRLLPDTLGVMQLPIPRRAQHEFYSIRGDHQYDRDTVSATLHIDTLGQARSSAVDRASPAVQAAVRRIVAAIKFHPAVGFDGQARSFSGRVFYEFKGSNTVRIRYAWLPQPIEPADSL